LLRGSKQLLSRVIFCTNWTVVTGTSGKNASFV
jgi:hypothetical protein